MTAFCYVLTAALNAFWLLGRNQLSVWAQMAIPVLSVALAAAGTALALPGLGAKGRRRRLRRLLWAVLLYYLAIISAMLFFGGLFHLKREWGGAVNLEPFHTIRSFFIHYRRTGSLSSLFNLLGNVAILLPLGVLLPLMFRGMRHFWTFLPLAALVSVGIEYVQWRTATGVADVDDSILNFAGAAAGYFLTRLCQIVYFWFRNRRRRRRPSRERSDPS